MNNIKGMLMILLLGSGLSLFGCGPAGSAIEDTTWVLKAYFSEHGHFHSVIEGTEVNALFDSTDGQVTGSAGCNRYFTGYEIKGSKVSITGPIAATEMFCVEPGVMDQESEYLSLLQTIDTFQVVEGELVFYSSGDPILVFVAQ